MRYEFRGQDPAVEMQDVWKRVWLSLIAVLAVMIGLGAVSASLLNAYEQTHCRSLTNGRGYLANVPATSGEAGVF